MTMKRPLRLLPAAMTKKMSSLAVFRHVLRSVQPSGALVCLCIGAAVFTMPRSAAASPQVATPAQRTVLGTVLNSAGTPADQAVVYLQDTKTMVIRSYVANGGGHFHFNQLSPDTDYQVWAEVNKHRSKTRTVSMFSSHLKFTYTLKIKG